MAVVLCESGAQDQAGAGQQLPRAHDGEEGLRLLTQRPSSTLSLSWISLFVWQWITC